jgi:hypothetical protein
MTGSNGTAMMPKRFSFFLVEDEVNPYNIYKVFDEIFGSPGNYLMENARSVFSAIVKLNYKLKHDIKSTLYIFDVRLQEKENKAEFDLCFNDNGFREELNRFYGVDGFTSYSKYKDLEIPVYDEFKENFGKDSERQKLEGFYVWAYNMRHSTKKFRSLIYSASPSPIKGIGWIKESGLLFVLEKSLFEHVIVSYNYDVFLNEIKRLSQGIPIKIHCEGKEIQHYENSGEIPEFEGKFVDNNGQKINIHNKDINYNPHLAYLGVSLNEKKTGTKPKNDYEDLLNILELCSEDLINDPDEYISWDSIIDVNIDDFTGESDILNFLEKDLGIYNNEYWTLRTLFPAQCYRVLNLHQDDPETQKKELKELIAKYGWNDYSEALSQFFNQGAVDIRVHSLDKHFCSENPGIPPTNIRNPFNKDEIIDSAEVFKKVWERQYKELILKTRNIDKQKFKHNTRGEEEKVLSWKEITDAFKDYQNKNLGDIRTYYLEYTAEKLFHLKEPPYYLEGSRIPIEIREGAIDNIKLFFPGNYFLDFIEEVKNDHIKKDRGEVKKCDIKITYIGETDIYIMSFILLVQHWKQNSYPRKDEALNFSLTRQFKATPLLEKFIRFNVILANAEGKRQIFNINNDFPLDPAFREIKIKGQTIVDIDREYPDKEINEIYVFSITASDLVKR